MMVYNDAGCYMMVYDGIWWHMIIYDGIWWYMIWYVMVYDMICHGAWWYWYMIVYDGIRATFGVISSATGDGMAPRMSPN